MSTDPKRKLLEGVRYLLVFHSFGFYTDTFAYMKNLRNLGVIPPINLLYVGAWLKSQRAQVELLDCHALNLPMEEALKEAEKKEFDFLCFTAVNLDFLYLKQWLRAFHSRFSAPILVGGVGARNYPQEIANLPEVTAVVHSPAETALVEWTRTYLDGGEWWKVPGTCARYENQTYLNEKLPIPKDGVIPLPARELLPDKDLYFSTLSEARPFTAGMSNFGCPYGCDYCSNRLTPVHPRSAEDIVHELEVCERQFGYKELDYFDANFLLPPERVYEIADRYAEKKLSIRWSCRARVDKIDESQLEAMARANCSWIGYGIESGDEEVLRGVNKYQGGIHKIRETLDLTKKHGIGITGFFILGLPGENDQSLQNTLEFMESAPFDFVQISPYWPVPGTPIYDRLVKESGMDPWKTVIETDSLDHDMPLPGTRFTLREMHEHTSRFYREFYFRPSQFLKILKRTSNLAQFKKYTTAGMDLIKSVMS